MSADDPTATALAHLARFRRVALGSMLRRLAHWTGLRAAHSDVLDDLDQELVVDCLENTGEIVALGERARHARWFRLLQKHHYRMRVRPARTTAQLDDLDPAVEAPSERVLDLAPEDRAVVERLVPCVAHLRNGRLNVSRTARALGWREERLRRTWRRLAARLGYDDEYVAFWRRRLVEALVGTAAGALVEVRALRRFGSDRLPAPEDGVRRLRRIASALQVCPQVGTLRGVLARCPTRSGAVDPGALLDDAARLAPACARVHLWRFEAAVASGELAVAAQSLRRARRAGADAVRVLLARARLLEARSREVAAARTLHRGARRHPHDTRLLRSLESLTSRRG